MDDQQHSRTHHSNIEVLVVSINLDKQRTLLTSAIQRHAPVRVDEWAGTWVKGVMGGGWGEPIKFLFTQVKVHIKAMQLCGEVLCIWQTNRRMESKN